MPRYKLLIEYDGTAFAGWQIQADLPTVQGVLAEAFAQFCGHKVYVAGAGRTDSGVHATGQVAHVDLEKDWRADTVRDAMTAYLRPHRVAVLDAEKVGDAFEARFSAVRRHYLYRIINRRPDLALERDRAWKIPQKLDAGTMAIAARRLLGTHDFTTFRAAECQAASPIKTLEQLDVTRQGEEIRIVTSARSFLHHQVRSMVGSLLRVGEGRWSADDLEAALKAVDRKRCGPMAPACGLYLTQVDYPTDL